MGSSQSGRFIRSLIHLGFNRDEQGRIVFEGALPHIGGGLMPLNIRFGQPGRATTDQTDHLFPGRTIFRSPMPASPIPLTGRTQGILDRCADEQHLSEDRSCRDGAGDVGVAPVARLHRSARA